VAGNDKATIGFAGPRHFFLYLSFVGIHVQAQVLFVACRESGFLAGGEVFACAVPVVA